MSPVPEPITTVESLDDGSRQRAVALLAGAFYDDPMQVWLFPHASRRERRLRQWFSLDIAHRLDGRSIVHRAGDNGIAFWQPPEAWSVGWWSALRVAPAFTSVAVHHPVLAARLGRRVLASHPEEPHWYLGHLAVSARARGQGIGQALVAAGVERADHQGMGCYLETTNPANLAFYHRAGFDELECITLPATPTVWRLWHPPGGP